MSAPGIAEFHYRIDWRARGLVPGAHRGSQRGGGVELAAHAPLLDAPDPRRYDLRASLRDPFERPLVKVYRQPAAVTVWALADLSASMAYRGEIRKLDLLADFIASLGYSAYRNGDRFGFFGCDGGLREEFSLAPTRRKTAGPELALRLRAFEPRGDSAAGLLAGAVRIARRRERSLVFLLSDFHFPIERLTPLLTSLKGQQSVPVVFWEPSEYRELPRFGLARLRDSETGRERTLWLRPALAARIRDGFDQRRRALQAVLTREAGAPLWLHGRFDPDQVTRHFYR